MRKLLKPGSFNFQRNLPKENGCRACKFNKMGVCKKIGKEVPITSGVANRKPKWCPGESK